MVAMMVRAPLRWLASAGFMVGLALPASAVTAAEDTTSPVVGSAEDTASEVLPADTMTMDIEAIAPSEAFKAARQAMTEGDYWLAVSLLELHLRENPGDERAQAMLIRARIAGREADLRDVVGEQVEMRRTVLGDPAYEEARALSDREVARLLTVAEYHIGNENWHAALEVVNRTLQRYEDSLAALRLKEQLLNRLYDLERRRLDKERERRRELELDQITRKQIMPFEPPPVPRTVFIFEEDINEAERKKLMQRLSLPIPSFSFSNAPVEEVLRQLFALAGINYILDDSAFTDQTLTLELQDETIENILWTIQRMTGLAFNYKGRAVYVTSQDSPVLVTDIYRLKSGLTDVQATASVSAGSVGGGGGAGGGGGGGGGGASFAGLGGGEGEGSTDLERLLEELPELVPWPEGSRVWLERKSNTLYIRSSPATVAEVKRMVQALDYNSTQVLIEARFVEVSDNATRDLGVNWAAGADRSSGNDTGIGGVVVGTPISPFTPNVNPQSFLQPPSVTQGANGGQGGLLTGVDFYDNGVLSVMGRLNALEQKGDADTLSEPKVLTLSNRQAIIDLSTEVPFVSDFEDRRNATTINTSGSGNTANPDFAPALVPVIETVNEGITLVVRPSVARNSDIVTMDIIPRVTDIIDIRTFPFQTVGTGGSAQVERPILGTRVTQTTLHVRDGETIVLGGLITADRSNNQNGVPGLMRVPGFGRLFRNDSMRSERRKLLIFVTAHIIDPTGARMSDEIRHLRNTARITLRPEIQAALHERQMSTEQTLRQLEEASRDQVE